MALLCFDIYSSYRACFLFMFISLGLLMAVIDYLEKHIYLFSLNAFAFVSISYCFYDPLPLKEHFLGFLIPFLFFKGCQWIMKDSFGDGDADLWVILGCVLGITNAIYAFIGSIYCATIYALYRYVFRKDALTSTIPYVPFIMISSFCVLVLFRI